MSDSRRRGDRLGRRNRHRLSDPLDRLDAAARELIEPSAPPDGADAMKAVLTEERFSDPDWIFERKLDGVRCVAVRDGKRDGMAGVRLLSRNNLRLNRRYPELAEALEGECCERFAIDGEVVAFQGSATSFARLAQRGERPVAVFLYVFDLLWLDGYDLRALPLRVRKRLLRSALRFHGPVRLTPYRNGDGKGLYEHACRQGWEGVIAKRAGSTYSGKRSRDWLKFKCQHGQEMVIGGYTQPRGSRVEFGALLLGYYDGAALRYAGKVGTGFDRETLRRIGDELRSRRSERPPFSDAAEIRERGATWVRPELVAEVQFSEWTRHGRLRHPRFLGLRDDKPAREVVRER